MTIEELAKLKKGDKLMWHRDVVTLDRVQVVVRDNGREARLNLEFLSVIPGPTLPPHVAAIWEWDGEPKKNGDIEGWVWDDGWPYPHYTFSYQWACPLYVLVPKIRKESK